MHIKTREMSIMSMVMIVAMFIIFKSLLELFMYANSGGWLVYLSSLIDPNTLWPDLNCHNIICGASPC